MGRCIPAFVLALAVSAQSAVPAGQSAEQIFDSVAKQRAVAAVNPEASQYVSALGGRLVAHLTAARSEKYKFVLYDDKEDLDAPWYGVLSPGPQLHVLPDGIILVPLALLDVSPTESEFAAGLARAIAHVELDHFARFMAARNHIAMPIPPAGSHAPVHPLTGDTLFPRSYEKEADGLSVEILASARFNPVALVRYVKNAAASFDTSEARVEAIERMRSELPRRTYGPDNSLEFWVIKQTSRQHAR